MKMAVHSSHLTSRCHKYVINMLCHIHNMSEYSIVLRTAYKLFPSVTGTSLTYAKLLLVWFYSFFLLLVWFYFFLFLLMWFYLFLFLFIFLVTDGVLFIFLVTDQCGFIFFCFYLCDFIYFVSFFSCH